MTLSLLTLISSRNCCADFHSILEFIGFVLHLLEYSACFLLKNGTIGHRVSMTISNFKINLRRDTTRSWAATGGRKFTGWDCYWTVSRFSIDRADPVLAMKTDLIYKCYQQFLSITLLFLECCFAVLRFVFSLSGLKKGASNIMKWSTSTGDNFQLLFR